MQLPLAVLGGNARRVVIGAVYSSAVMKRIPTADDVARTALVQDMSERNRQVTDGYYLFSQRFRQALGDEATWPTLATWASAQAGRTIRKEDLLRELERRLGDSEAVRRLVDGPVKLAASYVLRSVLDLNPFERSSQAVARGNIKVYEEIGSVFARFLALLEHGAGDEERRAFLESLAAGPPPDGQDYLRRALPLYLEAMKSPPGKTRSELMLEANVWIGLHEQTRLQPEIEASVDGAVWDFVEVKERLIARILPGSGWFSGIVNWWQRRRLEPLLEPVLLEAQRLVREIVTARMMVLELPGETLRLGQDIPGGFPESLRKIERHQLRELLMKADPTKDSTSRSGAENWADFGERMHFIADLFRARQLTARLFEAPRG